MLQGFLCFRQIELSPNLCEYRLRLFEMGTIAQATADFKMDDPLLIAIAFLTRFCQGFSPPLLRS